MATDWRSGFLAQARSDFDVLQLLARSPSTVASCHVLHYLQMTLEKLAKGMSCRPGVWGELPPAYRNHRVAVSYVQTLMRSGPRAAQLRRRTGWSPDHCRAYVRGILPAIQQIEELAPRWPPDTVNTEYPWAAPVRGQIDTPSEFDFRSLLSREEIVRVTQFVKIMLADASEL